MADRFLCKGRRRQSRRPTSALRLEALEDRLVPSLTPHLVKDINPGPGSSLAVGPTAPPVQFVEVKGVAFFVANDGVHGPELWKSNGTAAGTILVKDIIPGAPGS